MIWYGVVDIHNPSPEPFAVIHVDTDNRTEEGVHSTIVSLHHDRSEAQRIADGLNLSAGSASGTEATPQ